MNAKEMTEQAANATEDLQQQVKEKAGEWTGKVKETARDAGAAADLYVHEYAWTTVALIAVTAGVVGFILGRSQRD